ncbi:MAG: PadR family transcriptional regulator [Alphaproteobacteria bacterium]|nr:PadR family transcriptional regulator [Alphaproteobacteria bacterium]
MDVKTLCLGILAHGDASGYEIKKLFEQKYSHFYEASFGSIYPALARLTEAGLVSFSQQAQSKRPDKKVYRITTAGRIAFLDDLGKMPGRDRIRSDFLATLLFGDLLSPGQVDKMIAIRVAEYHALIDAMAACNTKGLTPGHAFVNGFGLTVYRAMVAYLENNRHALVGQTLLGARDHAAAAKSAQAQPLPRSQPAPEEMQT